MTALECLCHCVVAEQPGRTIDVTKTFGAFERVCTGGRRPRLYRGNRAAAIAQLLRRDRAIQRKDKADMLACRDKCEESCSGIANVRMRDRTLWAVKSASAAALGRPFMVRLQSNAHARRRPVTWSRPRNRRGRYLPSGYSVRPHEGKESAFANFEEGWFFYFSNLADR